MSATLCISKMDLLIYIYKEIYMTEYLILKGIECLQWFSYFIRILILEATLLKMPLYINAQYRCQVMFSDNSELFWNSVLTPSKIHLIFNPFFGGGDSSWQLKTVFPSRVLMFMQECLYMNAWVHCLQRAEEGTIPGARVAGSYEPSRVGSGN